MLSELGRDLYKAEYRIFDHRVFVNGEIDTFLSNFETQRNDLEVESLFKITESVGALKYQLSDKCINLSSNNLNTLSNELQKSLVSVEDFLQKVQHKNPSNKILISTRSERLERRQRFEKELFHNYQRVDNSIANKEEEIAELYSDLQVKLNISK